MWLYCRGCTALPAIGAFCEFYTKSGQKRSKIEFWQRGQWQWQLAVTLLAAALLLLSPPLLLMYSPQGRQHTRAQTQCHAPRSMQHFLCCCSSTNDFALTALQITVYAHITRACRMPHEANHQSSIRQFSQLDSLCLISIN